MSRRPAVAAPATAAGSVASALVVASHGRHCLIETDDGRRLIAHPRGKKNQAVVGDRVRWVATGDEASIEGLQTRRNLFYRQDEIRTKSFAANLDRVLILLAAEPEFSESQLARALVACEAERIVPIIALNKRDLGEAFARAWQRLAPYRAMGYAVLGLSLAPKEADSAPSGLEELVNALRGQHTLVLGPSGTGKSTLINRLVPEAQAETGEISQALNSGKHTTTDTRWYWAPSLDGEGQRGALIDSPGFQEFGLHHIEATRLAECMPDMRQHLGQCRFYNCTHLHEPGCAVLAQCGAHDGDAWPQGRVSERRHRIYAQLFEELSRQRW